MSEDMEIVLQGGTAVNALEQRCTWKATGLNGHSDVFGSEFLYTSQDAPVEADEYERMTKRADALLVERDAAIRRAEAADALVTERTTVVEQLQMALHLRDTQLTAMTTERDALRAQRDALQVDAGALVRLRDDTDNILWSLKPADIPGAINWGDLGTRETQQVIDESRQWYRVVIEEADPANPALHAAVLAGLVAVGWTADDIEIETDW